MRKKAVFTVIVCIVGTIIGAGCIHQTLNGNVTTDVISKVTSVVPTIAFIQTDSTAGLTPEERSRFYITINPIDKHFIGEVFELNGTTNLPVDSKIVVTITSPLHELAPTPNQNTIVYPTSYLQGIAKIVSRDQDQNVWSYKLNLSGFDNYTQYYALVDGSYQNIYVENLTEMSIFPFHTNNLIGGESK